MGLLVKDAVVTEVSERIPPQPAQPAIPLRIYGPALPIGWRYRTPPASGAGFAQWAPRYQATVGASVTTTVFVAVEAWPSYPYNPATQSYSLRYDDKGMLLGYWVTTTAMTGSAPDTVNYYANTGGIELISFPESETKSNGYPIGPVGSIHRGRFSYGPLLFYARFIKDAGGFMKNLDAFPEIAHSEARPAHGLFALIDVPGIPATPSVPAVMDVDQRIGWNAGADSDANLDGDVRVVFEPAIVGAGAVGFVQDRDDVGDPTTLSHAFYFDNDPSTGRKRFCAIESGRRVSGYAEYAAGLSFEIKRVGVYGEVTYRYDGNLIATSAAPLYGAVRVGTSLYRAGDGVL